jgi:beta-mannosidase
VPPVLRITTLDKGWELASRRWLTPPARLGYFRLEWLPATVPGHVHEDLRQNGVIPDPFTELSELGCQWVDEEDWSYKTTFEVQRDSGLPRRVLRFEGLDTLATISLDGEVVARHENMFVPLELDVTHLDEGQHELRVDFASAVRTGRERRSRYFAAQGLSENTLRFDDRAFVRKAQYMFGWDWGPRLVSCGIWQPVRLIAHAGRLLDVHITQRHDEDGSVELRCQSQIDGEGEVLHFVEGEQEPLRDGQTLRIEKPRLWWPAGLGEPALLLVTSYLVPPGTPPGAHERATLDQRRTRVGLRRLRLLRVPDRFGESFEFEVNGERFFALGANWIPDHSFPGLVKASELREQLGRARDMNMNMLRVWGGGLYESETFYDACDELGLLVWQDFLYACSYYPEDEASLALATTEARVNIERLRRHPSLALWCGNNENLTMFQDGWEDPTRHPPYYYGKKIYEEILPALVEELDPTRPYVPSSPFGGERANQGGVGDQHYWDVWHGRGDWKHYDDSTARFSSEFGFAAAPSPKALARMAPGATDVLALDPRDRIARFHDKTLKGYETFIGMVELHYPKAENLGEWSYYSQLNQRDALRHGIEHYRRSDFCRGSLIWQLNDCWPVQSWAVVDSTFAYKAAAFELRRLYAPLLASLVLGGGKARLYAVLDNCKHPVSVNATLEARSLEDGRSLAHFATAVTLAPNERRLALEADCTGFDPATTIVVATLGDSTTFRLLGEPKDTKSNPHDIEASFDGSALTLECRGPLVDLFVWDEEGKIELFDNFVTLPAGGHVTLRARGELGTLRARSLAGLHSVT